MLETLLWTLVGGTSGSVLYIIAVDVYKFNTGKTRYCAPITIYRLKNYGLYVGGIIGFFRGYLGIPILDYLI